MRGVIAEWRVQISDCRLATADWRWCVLPPYRRVVGWCAGYRPTATPYSTRMASTGSTAAARRAGKYAATIATESNAAAIPT